MAKKEKHEQPKFTQLVVAQGTDVATGHLIPMLFALDEDGQCWRSTNSGWALQMEMHAEEPAV